MTYYEELCIPSSATPDEIHLAHRRLIKILHPDLQIDENARRLAEAQTSRINAFVGILLDPAGRKEYDEAGLRVAPSHPYPSSLPRKDGQYGSLTNFVITGLFVLAGLWLLESSDRPTLAQQPSASAPTPDRSSIPPVQVVHRRREPSIASETQNRSPAPKEIPAESSRRAAPGVLSTNPPEPLVRQPHETARLEPDERASPSSEKLPDRPQPQSTELHPPATPAEEQSPLIGTWIYVPPPITDENRKLYRPEYIEMRIREVQGILDGQYRARYHVPDRPLSPNVGFHFAGKCRGNTANFEWHGSNGLAGRVEMKMTSANSVQVDWRVTELADSADLVSGTASLIRVQ